MKRLLYWLGIIDLVWAVHHDGEATLRIVWALGDQPWVFGICGPPMFWDVTRQGGVLLADGTIKAAPGNSYLKTWVRYDAGKPKKSHGSQHAWIHPFLRLRRS